MKNKLKNIGAFIVMLAIGTGAMAQEETPAPTKPAKKQAPVEAEEKDTTKVKIGKTKILIIKDEGEDDSDSLVIIDSDTINTKKKRAQRTNKFAGLDMGFNGFLSSTNSTDLPEGAEFMSEEPGRKSLEVAINFWEKYIPIAKEKFGIMTGIGLLYNNYELSNDVTLINQGDSTTFFFDASKTINKNKFKTTNIHVPLMLETNIGKDAEHSFHLAIGGTAAYRLNVRTKQKFKQDGENYKVKDRNDFNVNDFQFSAAARIGYGDFTLYATYSLTSLFEEDKGPEIYPFTIGLSVLSF